MSSKLSYDQKVLSLAKQTKGPILSYAAGFNLLSHQGELLEYFVFNTLNKNYRRIP